MRGCDIWQWVLMTGRWWAGQQEHHRLPPQKWLEGTKLINLESSGSMLSQTFHNKPHFLRGALGTYLKRFLRKYWPNSAQASRWRASWNLPEPGPALLRLFMCCIRMDHLSVFVEYNIRNPRPRLNNSRRSIRQVDMHKVIHQGPSNMLGPNNTPSIHVTLWRWERHTNEWGWLISYLTRPLPITVRNPTIVTSILPAVCYSIRRPRFSLSWVWEKLHLPSQVVY